MRGKLWTAVAGAGTVCVCVEMVSVLAEMGGKQVILLLSSPQRSPMEQVTNPGMHKHVEPKLGSFPTHIP